MNKGLLLATASSLVILGCGGGDSSDNATSNESTTDTLAQAVNGKLIDGYISGATVFLDINFNSQLDDGEPFVVTSEDGDFTFADDALTSEACWKWVPIVALVPADAIDSDNPEQPIGTPYKMTFPPSGLVDNNSDVFVTPLTTEIWNGALGKLHDIDFALSCDELSNDESMRDELDRLIVDETEELASELSVNTLTLFTDYVATANSELHTEAKEIVSVLKAAYEAESSVSESDPDALYIHVSFFEDDGDQIRYTKVTMKDGYVFDYDVMSEDLTAVVKKTSMLKIKLFITAMKQLGLNTIEL
ncbi:hypothetical protein [Vibrio algarum]|uniref:Lipoprotein n=1 Tax=Vibrio algarum TaxID=3020714 RepID=A0ABT4YQH2_9VIBR|nr:hypothetical protein [Vibrio sp. KJ40-1]MDB1123803.1 hypothetical protein [Vibrio sp. KJ40-1]